MLQEILMSYLRIRTTRNQQHTTYTLRFNNQRWHVLDNTFRVVESFLADREQAARQFAGLTPRR